MTYQIFYWTHIVSYIAWLLAFLGSLFFGFKIRAEDDAVRRRKFMRSERLMTRIGAHIAAVGILISGSVISSIPRGPQWGWFNIQLYPWLTLKQIIFIIILVLIGFSIKRSRAFEKRRLKEKDVLSTGTSDKWRKAYRTSIAVYILVVISTLLGLFKPGLGNF